jgi:hypothetical protein
VGGEGLVKVDISLLLEKTPPPKNPEKEQWVIHFIERVYRLRVGQSNVELWSHCSNIGTLMDTTSVHLLSEHFIS